MANDTSASTNLYQVYINQCLQLAATLAIKSTDTALATNSYISAVYGGAAVDETDPTTWKYHMNLAGEYHFTNEMMTVISMDTLETIDFTKANLLIHPATSRAYQYGTRSYNELLSRYPDQELLIRGVLYPVDLSVAANARDGLILGGYPPSLVEVNEYSLLDRLQQWIDAYKLRWYNQSYTVSDNLYLTSNLGMMYAYLPMAIITSRWDVVKTNEAHSFHVRQYLASHGGLDEYVDQLTTSQALSLYRNILYLERNPGTRATFSWLTNKLLTERVLPLAQYTMRHDTSQMLEGTSAPPVVTGGLNTSIYPQIFFKRDPLNLGYSYDTQDDLSLDQMLTKEQPVAPDNSLIQSDVTPQITKLMRNSRSNVLQTKALDSTMVDYTDSTPYTLESVLLNHWLWLSAKGLYTAIVNVENPHTGERIALPAADAFVFYWYAYCAAIGIDLVDVPPLVAERVQRIPTPTPQDLYSIVDPSKIGIDVAQWMLSYTPVIGPMISINAFYAQAQKIWRAENTQRNIVAYQEHKDRRGMADNMFNRIYCDAVLELAPGENYTQWFAERNISITGWSKDDFATISVSLARAAMGLDLTTSTSLANLQKAMIGALQQLSSYSIQFMSSINQGAIVPLDWPMIRLGDIHSHLYDTEELPIIQAGLRGVKAVQQETFKLPVFFEEFDLGLESQIGDHYFFEVADTINLAKGQGTTYFERWDLEVGISYTPEVPANSEGIVPVLGIDQYLKLSLSQQQSIKDIYGSCWQNQYQAELPLNMVIHATELTGLIYTQPDT